MLHPDDMPATAAPLTRELWPPSQPDVARGPGAPSESLCYYINMTSPLTGLPVLQHVTLNFTPGGEQQLRAFYAGVLGFREKPVPRVAKPLGWIWFYTAQDGIELHLIPDPRPVPADSTYHFCIHMADLESCRTSLAKAGFPIREALALPTRPRFFTRDPFDNLIEVVSVEGDYIAAGEGAL